MPVGSGRPPMRGQGRTITKAAKVPQLRGEEWTEAVRAWWRAVWTSPWSGLYTPQDEAGLRRLAVLMVKQAKVERGETVTKTKGEESWEEPLEFTAAELAAIAQLEDRYGLSPRARQVLGWDEWDEAPPAPPKGSTTPAAQPTDDVAAQRRKRLTGTG